MLKKKAMQSDQISSNSTQDDIVNQEDIELQPQGNVYDQILNDQNEDGDLGGNKMNSKDVKGLLQANEEMKKEGKQSSQARTGKL